MKTCLRQQQYVILCALENQGSNECSGGGHVHEWCWVMMMRLAQFYKRNVDFLVRAVGVASCGSAWGSGSSNVKIQYLQLSKNAGFSLHKILLYAEQEIDRKIGGDFWISNGNSHLFKTKVYYNSEHDMFEVSILQCRVWGLYNFTYQFHI